MRATTMKIQRWGDSLAVRLPSTVVRDMRLAPGQSIEVSCRGGVITMRMVAKRESEPSLRERLNVVRRVRDGTSAVVGRMR